MSSTAEAKAPGPMYIGSKCPAIVCMPTENMEITWLLYGAADFFPPMSPGGERNCPARVPSNNPLDRCGGLAEGRAAGSNFFLLNCICS